MNPRKNPLWIINQTRQLLADHKMTEEQWDDVVENMRHIRPGLIFGELHASEWRDLALEAMGVLEAQEEGHCNPPPGGD
jgi:hypothetical protein